MTVIAKDWTTPGPATENKLWGTSQLVVCSKSLVVTRIEIVPGGYCSVHRHVGRHNEFIVESGRLLVVTHGEGDQPAASAKAEVLGAGDHVMIYSGDWHRFIAMSPVRAYEIYRSSKPDEPVDMSDIVRKDVGGVLVDAPYHKFSPLLFFG